MSSKKSNFLTCDICGKKGFTNKKALSRHKKRSKLCNGIRQLPLANEILEDALKKMGVVLM